MNFKITHKYRYIINIAIPFLGRKQEIIERIVLVHKRANLSSKYQYKPVYYKGNIDRLMFVGQTDSKTSLEQAVNRVSTLLHKEFKFPFWSIETGKGLQIESFSVNGVEPKIV